MIFKILNQYVLIFWAHSSKYELVIAFARLQSVGEHLAHTRLHVLHRTIPYQTNTIDVEYVNNKSVCEDELILW